MQWDKSDWIRWKCALTSVERSLSLAVFVCMNHIYGTIWENKEHAFLEIVLDRLGVFCICVNIVYSIVMHIECIHCKWRLLFALRLLNIQRKRFFFSSEYMASIFGICQENFTISARTIPLVDWSRRFAAFLVHWGNKMSNDSEKSHPTKTKN